MSKNYKSTKLALFLMVMVAAASQDCMTMARTPKNMAQSKQSVQSNVQSEQFMINKLKETAARHKGKIIAGVGILGAGALAYLSKGAIGTIAEAKKELINVDAEVIDRAGAKLETSTDDGIQQEEVVDNNKTPPEIGQPINAINDETGYNQTSTTEADLNSTALETSAGDEIQQKAIDYNETLQTTDVNDKTQNNGTGGDETPQIIGSYDEWRPNYILIAAATAGCILVPTFLSQMLMIIINIKTTNVIKLSAIAGCRAGIVEITAGPRRK